MLAEISDFTFREAIEEDVEEMARLDAICFSAPWSYKDFLKEITGNKLALYVVAEKDGRVQGYAGLWCILDEGHITNVAVHPDHRKKGLGFTLVKTLLDLAQKIRQVKSFTLEVRVSNGHAIKLYQKFGFVEMGKRKGYYTDNKEDASIMWLMDRK